MPYALPSDLTSYFDTAVVADLAADDGAPVPDTTNNANINRALSSASGEINSAVLVGGIYASTDLAALTGDDMERLKELTCTLAMAKLLRRRPEKYGSEAYQAFVEDTEETLDRIRKGERLFNLPAPIDAGQPEVDGPTIATVERLNLITVRAKHFFPLAGRRLPIGRG